MSSTMRKATTLLLRRTSQFRTSTTAASLSTWNNPTSSPLTVNSKDDDTIIAAPCIGNVRHMSRKGSKMGHHLETIENLGVQERRKKKKGGASPAASVAVEEEEDSDDMPEMEHDESESTFDDNTNKEGNDEEDALPTLPDPNDVKQRMLKVVTHLENSFRAIRGSEPTPELFEVIPVSAYDSTMPLSSLAQVVISTPTRVLLNCFDPSTAPAVRDAVRDSGKNLNPMMDENDKGTIVVPMPRPSAETRASVVKQLGKQTEVAKQRVRRIRRGAQDVVKKGKDGKLEGISKDDAFRVGKEIDGVTEEVGGVLDGILKKKTEDVMAI